jgi:hypothetical protein
MRRRRPYGYGMYPGRARNVSFVEAKSIIKRYEAMNAAKDEIRDAVTGNTDVQAVLNVSYIMPFCGAVPEPTWCMVDKSIGGHVKCIAFLVSSKGALAKSLKNASTKPDNIMFVHGEIASNRHIWTGESKEYIPGAKAITFFDGEKPPTLAVMFGVFPAEFIQVINQAEWCIKQCLYAVFGLNDGAARFSDLGKLPVFGGKANKAILSMTCLSMIRCSSEVEVVRRNVEVAHAMYHFMLFGTAPDVDAPIFEVFRFATPEHSDNVNAVIGSSYITPTSNGFGFFTNCGLKASSDYNSVHMRCIDVLGREADSFTAIISCLIQGDFSIDSFADAFDMMVDVEWRVWSSVLTEAGANDIGFIIRNALALREGEVGEVPSTQPAMRVSAKDIPEELIQSVSAFVVDYIKKLSYQKSG